MFGEGANSARGAMAILAVATTLGTCEERPFTRMIANGLLHSKQQKERNSSSNTASYSTAQSIATETNNAATPLAELLGRHACRTKLPPKKKLV